MTLKIALAEKLATLVPDSRALVSPEWFGCDALLVKGRTIISYVSNFVIDHNKEDYPIIIMDRAKLRAWDRANSLILNNQKQVTPLSLAVEFADGFYAMRVSASWEAEYEHEYLDGEGLYEACIVKIPTKGFVKMKPLN